MTYNQQWPALTTHVRTMYLAAGLMNGQWKSLKLQLGSTTIFGPNMSRQKNQKRLGPAELAGAWSRSERTWVQTQKGKQFFWPILRIPVCSSLFQWSTIFGGCELRASWTTHFSHFTHFWGPEHRGPHYRSWRGELATHLWHHWMQDQICTGTCKPFRSGRSLTGRHGMCVTDCNTHTDTIYHALFAIIYVFITDVAFHLPHKIWLWYPNCTTTWFVIVSGCFLKCIIFSRVFP